MKPVGFVFDTDLQSTEVFTIKGHCPSLKLDTSPCPGISCPGVRVRKGGLVERVKAKLYLASWHRKRIRSPGPPEDSGPRMVRLQCPQ